MKLADGSLFLFAQRPLVPDDKAMALLDANGIDLLVASAKALEPLEDWTRGRNRGAHTRKLRKRRKSA
ncbi:MAG: hypothetical protein LKM31_03155 [Sphingobium sp.]|jgi:glutamyl-tRNA synthetase|nr:hypothetical protein [Sphingobium sp.]